MMKLYLLACLLMGVGIAVSSADDLDDEFERFFFNLTGESVENSVVENDNFFQAVETFSANLYEKVSRNESKSVLLSPLSVNLALSMVAFGAGGNSRRELLQTLNLIDNPERIKSRYENLYQTLKNISGAELSILNKVFVSSRLNVKQTFKDVLKQNYRAEEEQLDFANAPQAVAAINSWVSNGTNGKIKEIFTASDLDSDTAMVLSNVVYFKGEWENKFEDYNNLYFNSADGRRSLVTGMKQKVHLYYGYIAELKACIVELPYKAEGLKMIVVLPDNGVNLEEVERGLETSNVKDALRWKVYTSLVTLKMPQFRVETSIELVDVLKEMGVQEIFTSKANLTGISEQKIEVSKIKQKVFIDVNKEGSEAAAATAVVAVFRSGRIYEADVTVDRPFHFKIIKTVNESEDIVLFSGNYKG